MSHAQKESSSPPLSPKRGGFTLIELAVVLFLVSLLLGGLLLPLAAQQDAKMNGETRRSLEEIREALMGYAAMQAKPFLPCPDADGDGKENRTPVGCAQLEGDLPWRDLGLGQQDAWGRRFRYRVSAAFADSQGFQLATTGDLRICGNTDCTLIIADKLPLVVFSAGKNGAFEEKNADANDKDFSLRDASIDFDDLLVWIPSAVLISRMLVAGRLP
ncbi:MAG: prepilin-type N-terminal cleavage/methylation domain-containing protein [Rhodocyclaceae bacterium]|nr:prepilin-type N-terminal cleavage/methylation domain-containing protein [Rhodocyclaceae bacterium]